MNKPSILYYDCLNYTKKNTNLLLKNFQVYTLQSPFHDGQLLSYIAEEIEAIFLPYGFSFSARKWGEFPKLRVIASNTTTIPDVEIPVKGKVIYLDNSEFLADITCTAEHTLGLILAVHRRLPHAHWSTWTEWNRYKWGTPKMLSKCNLAIWGPGRVGTHLFDRAVPLFRTVWTIAENDRDDYIENILRASDVLALTMSMKLSNKGIVSAEHLALLPDGAIVVNTANGQLIDHKALLQELKSGRLSAGLDVLPYDHRFQYHGYSPEAQELIEYTKTNENLILTPHIAGSTEDAWMETQRDVIYRTAKELGCPV